MSLRLAGICVLLALAAPAAAAERGQVIPLPDMVTIPAGNFLMGKGAGSSAEQPVHVRRIAQFKLGKFEVTRAQFAAFVAASGWRTDAERNTEIPDRLAPAYTGSEEGCGGFDAAGRFDFHASLDWRAPGFTQTGEHPVVCVSLGDAQAYVQWLAQETGRRFRLPSEAELEYSIRARSTSTFPWGPTAEGACRHANGRDRSALAAGVFREASLVLDCTDGYAHTAPVGRFDPNAFGLYDTSGNVMEWTGDCADGDSDAAEDSTPRVTRRCDLGIARGGAWISVPARLAAAYRFLNAATDRAFAIGIRVAEDL